MKKQILICDACGSEQSKYNNEFVEIYASPELESKYEEIHFCSPHCAGKYFFDNYKIEQTEKENK